VAAATLAVVATALLAYGGALLYVKQEIGRESAFAARMVSSLDDPAVRGVVSERSVDALLTGSAGDLVAVRPLMIAAVDALVASPPFKRVLLFGIEDAHRALAQGKGSVIVEGERTARLLIGALRSVSPSVARRTSVDVEPVLARIDRDLTVLAVIRSLLDRAASAWVVLGLALAAALGALAVSRDRRATVVHLGAGMVGAGMLVAGAVWLGERVATGHAARATSVAGDRDGRALEAVWQALFADARTAALVVALGGLLVAAVAAGARYPGGVAEIMRARLRTVRIPRWLRRAGLVGAGIVCLLEPSLVARAVVVIGGGVLIAWGAGEAAAALHARLGPPSDARSRAAGRPGAGGFLVAIAAAAISAAAFVAAGVIALDVPQLPAADPAPREGCNGSRALCDRRLNEVVWPATHNSYAASDQLGWYFANQRRGIARQLDDGITALLIDVHWGVTDARTGRVRTDLRAEGSDRNKVIKQLGPRAVRTAERVAGRLGNQPLKGPRALYLCHTLCELGAEPLDAELAAIRSFLERHPDDVLLLVIEDYVPPADIRAALQDAGLLGYAAQLDRNLPLPTLRELVRDGERLVIFAEKEGGTYPWYMPAFSFIQDTPLGNRRSSDFSCERFRGDADSPILMLNHWIDRFPPRVSDNVLVGGMRFLSSRIARCARERGVPAGVVAVDFYERGAVVEVARDLNH